MNFNQEPGTPNWMTIGPWISHAMIELKMQIVTISAVDEVNTVLAIIDPRQHARATNHDFSTWSFTILCGFSKNHGNFFSSDISDAFTGHSCRDEEENKPYECYQDYHTRY